MARRTRADASVKRAWAVRVGCVIPALSSRRAFGFAQPSGSRVRFMRCAAPTSSTTGVNVNQIPHSLYIRSASTTGLPRLWAGCVSVCLKCASGGFSAPLRRGLAPVAPACQGYVPLAVRRAVQRPASPPTPVSVGREHFCCSAPRRADGAVPAPSQLGTRFSFSPPLLLSNLRAFGFAPQGGLLEADGSDSPDLVDCWGRLPKSSG